MVRVRPALVSTYCFMALQGCKFWVKEKVEKENAAVFPWFLLLGIWWSKVWDLAGGSLFPLFSLWEDNISPFLLLFCVQLSWFVFSVMMMTWHLWPLVCRKGARGRHAFLHICILSLMTMTKVMKWKTETNTSKHLVPEA